MQVLPLFCNSDYWGMSQLHGTLLRRGTCGNADRCDYCVVGSENSMAEEYEIIKEEAGFLVSRKIEKGQLSKESCPSCYSVENFSQNAHFSRRKSLT